MNDVPREGGSTSARRPLRILYYQVTIGPAHLARVRALDAQPGLSCVAVQLASAERTRAYRLEPNDRAIVETVSEGVYEDLPLLGRLRAAASHFRSSGADVIIVDSPADPVQWMLGLLASLRGALAVSRWAATIHDHPRVASKELAKRLVYRGWDHYLVTGKRAAEYLESFGVPASAYTFCGNPVDAEAIDRARERASRDRARTFLFVGRFLALKNLDRFLSAFLRYRREGGTWGLKIVGTGEPEVVERLQTRVAGDDSVEFAGHLQFSALLDAYLREGCLVLPSYSENWGLVVNEAMHAGMPILLSERCGCYPDLFVEGRHGYGMDPFDEESMATALHKMEQASPEDRAAFSRASIETISSETPQEWARRVSRAISGASE